MKIKTTFCIKNSLFVLLKNAAENRNKTISDLISIILQIMIGKELFSLNTNNAVKYQKTEETDVIVRKHIIFSSVDYEVVHDLKRLTKKSASFLIGEGIRKYLFKIVSGEFEDLKTDNSFFGYYINWGFKNGRNRIKIIWDFPEELMRSDNCSGKIKTIKELEKFLL